MKPGDTVDEGGHSQSANCLNCATPLTGRHCHECGQPAHVHKTLGAFWHDLLHGVLHFEGRIWRTLPLLAWRPGELTRRYVDGERARFVSPMALFLFSAFLTFAVVNAAGGPIGFGNSRTGQNVREGMAESLKQAEARLPGLERERARIAAGGGDTRAIDASISNLRNEISLIRLMKDRGIAEATITRAADDLPEGPSWLGEGYRKAKENPSLLIYKLQNNAYKYSWALIPISVPFLWLLFPFSRRFGLYDHVVFVTYSLSFVTLLTVALSLLRVAGLPNPAIVLSLLLLPPVHMYRQLRGAYALGRFGALWRTLLLMIFAVLASSLFMFLLLALGIMG